MHAKRRNSCEARKSASSSFLKFSKKKKVKSTASRKRIIPTDNKVQHRQRHKEPQKELWRMDEFAFLLPPFFCIDLLSNYILSDAGESATLPDAMENFITVFNSLTFFTLCEIVILNILFVLLLQLSKIAAENYFFIFFSCLCITIFPRLVMFPENIIQDGTLLTPRMSTVVSFLVYFVKMCLFKNAHFIFHDV